MDKVNRLLAGFMHFVALMVFSVSCLAADVTQSQIDQDLDGLSGAMDDLARDISLLEEELLFPPLTRVQVYLSMSPDVSFKLRSLMLSIDGVEKSFHIYSDNDLAALRLGGIQRFWEGNIALGEHEVQAIFKGVDRKNNEIKQIVDFTFEKTLGGHSLELAINASDNRKRPAFVVKDWGEKQ